MLKIGEFSKASHLTVKALRFYEKEGILIPAHPDRLTGYRYYETGQLKDASEIKAYRQLDLSIDEIKRILSGTDEKKVLSAKAETLMRERAHIDFVLSSIRHILEESKMQYHVTEKIIGETVVYSAEAVLEKYADIMEWIPSVGQACLKLNPDLKCAEPNYEFCEYLDGEYRETNLRIRHSEAVERMGREDDLIQFRKLPQTKVLSVFHKGSYDNIGQAYAYLLNYAKENGYVAAGTPRECYIDGIWNRESEQDWLTEVQLPVESFDNETERFDYNF